MITAKFANKLKTLFAVAVVMLVTGVASPDTFTVINTNDSGPGSLRQAIVNANANPGLDIVAFHIPGPGPHTVRPLSPLPRITDPVIIDGYTQPDAQPATYNSPATLRIEIDGAYTTGDDDLNGYVNGLTIWGGSCTIRGLVINNFCDYGIRIGANGGNTIQGNYIGTDVTGTEARPNAGFGVSVYLSGNLIGGTAPEDRNVLSGNGYDNAHIRGAGNMVQGNYIGTDATGTVTLGNTPYGVLISGGIETNNNTIGPGNVISGNVHAITILNDPVAAAYNVVQGNLIGTDASGTLDLGNSYGIRILGSNNNMIRDNIISFSEYIGITVGESDLGGDHNVVTGNTISFSGGLGLEIGSSNDNTIYNNNFIENGSLIGYQVVDHGGAGNVFSLDKPLGGNYWSDWTAPDYDYDGFVDQPYLIWTVDPEYDNQDDLPWACEDGWRTGCDGTLPSLIAQVAALDLPPGTENSLITKLENAAAKLGDENPANDQAVVNSLEAFIHEIEAQRGKKILEDDANALITAAEAIISALSNM